MLTYDVTVSEKEHIQIKVAKNMIHVEVMGRPAKFEGSVGVMGTYIIPNKYQEPRQNRMIESHYH
jgi:hypothetical protein